MLAFIGGLGAQEIFVILLVVLVIFGAKKLPEMARSLGQGVKEFRKSVREITESADEPAPESKSTPKPP